MNCRMLRCSFSSIVALLGIVVAVGAEVEILRETILGKSTLAQFRTADTDGNGRLNKNEFGAMLEAFKTPAAVLDFHEPNDPSGDNIPSDFRKSVEQTEKSTQNFWAAFINSVAMIIVTELGDKTFFIAAVLAMRHSQITIFGGAISALALMTVLSSLIGFALPSLLPREYTHYAATLLFVYFGIKLLKEGLDLVSKGEGMGPSEELEEVELSLKEKNDGSETSLRPSPVFSTFFWQTFTLTFLAEWGDRSQIATIALASAKDPVGVTIGGILGHSLCTGIAVLGGKVIAGKISERNVLIVGGILFLVFAAHALIAGA